MIHKQDVLDRAAEWRLTPGVVEKDYVLGWLLHAIGSHPETSQSWIFKGGTCIKKCYFETYRFSEDLDFSLLPEAAYSEDHLMGILRGLTAIAHEQSGIEFPEDLTEIRLRKNKQGQITFEGRISYRGPMGGPRNLPRVLLDLTQHEPVLATPVHRAIFHPYPDAFSDEPGVLTYAIDELFAEKTRALYERTRPRDLYDVVYLLENQPESFDLIQLCNLFRRKCEVKQLAIPKELDLIALVMAAEELRSEWHNMLGHQLPQLPDLDEILQRLPELLGWIDEPAAILPVTTLGAVPLASAEERVAPAGIRAWGAGSPLELLRFAGSNRLLVEFDYHAKHRHAEPYSLRRAGTGNILFYGFEIGSHVKAFKVDEMHNVSVTSQPFQPRYRIEITSASPAVIPSITSSHPNQNLRQSPSPSGGRRQRQGPVYVFRCPHCSKEFRHTKNDATLHKHKRKDSAWDCPGRRGFYVRTEWK